MNRDLDMIWSVLGEFRLLKRTMTVNDAAMFIVIANHDQRGGISVSELAAIMGTESSSTKTHHWTALSDHHYQRDKNGLPKPGLGLVYAGNDYTDWRRKPIRLKPQGKALLERVLRAAAHTEKEPVPEVLHPHADVLKMLEEDKRRRRTSE